MSSLLNAIITDLQAATPAEIAALRAMLIGDQVADDTVAVESTADAAARLGVTPKTVAGWCRDGRIDGAMQIGQTWRVPAGCTPGATPPVARPSRARARSRTSSTADRIGGSASARIRRATSTTGGPGDAPTSRGPAQRNGSPMSSNDGTRRGDAAKVIPINGGMAS